LIFIVFKIDYRKKQEREREQPRKNMKGKEKKETPRQTIESVPPWKALT
jgi:hypothetical protein